MLVPSTVHEVKPIAVEKARQVQGSDTCNPSEKTKFRALVGDPVASATVSFFCKHGRNIQSCISTTPAI